jgi:hypothetical protein
VASPDALDQVRHSLDTGLLHDHSIDGARLRVGGDQVIAFAPDPLAER